MPPHGIEVHSIDHECSGLLADRLRGPSRCSVARSVFLVSSSNITKSVLHKSARCALSPDGRIPSRSCTVLCQPKLQQIPTPRFRLLSLQAQDGDFVPNGKRKRELARRILQESGHFPSSRRKMACSPYTLPDLSSNQSPLSVRGKETVRRRGVGSAADGGTRTGTCKVHVRKSRYTFFPSHDPNRLTLGSLSSPIPFPMNLYSGYGVPFTYNCIEV